MARIEAVEIPVKAILDAGDRRRVSELAEALTQFGVAAEALSQQLRAFAGATPRRPGVGDTVRILDGGHHHGVRRGLSAGRAA